MLRTLVAILSLAIMSVADFALQAVPTGMAASHLEQAVDSTDRYLNRRDMYLARKKASINSITERLKTSSARDSMSVLMDLARAFRRYDVDSAALCYQTAVDIAAAHGDSANMRRALLGLSSVNILRGIVLESVTQFESVDPKMLDSADMKAYYDAGFDVYLTTAAFYPDGRLADLYMQKAIAMSDSLAACLGPDSPRGMYQTGWSALQRGDMPSALAEMRSALDATPFGDELYARIAATLADYYRNIAGKDDLATYYLALSSMSDLAAGTREMTSLQRLGLELYRRGDIARAYRYLNVALDNSIESGSTVRALTVLDALPIISKAYNDKDELRIRWLYVMIVVLSASLIATIVVMVANRRSHRRLVDYKSRLAENNTLKDEYIKQILSLCSSYIEQNEELNRLIIRKIKAGQSQDLLRMAESGEVLRQQSDKFLKSFDETFVRIYPDFIDNINSLLNPKDRFARTSDKKLNPELRIAAFMRLGVDDSSRIARFLGLSLNTVYTYRNKLKNRAVDRDTFESKIKNIGDFPLI